MEYRMAEVKKDEEGRISKEEKEEWKKKHDRKLGVD